VDLKLGYLKINMKISRQKIGIHLLRLGLAAVFLWFGFSQLINSLSWVVIVPQWAIDLAHLPPAMIVMINGIFEIILGGLLAMGFFVRIVSFVLALHLLVIAFDFGFTAIGVRDLGLVIASFAFSLMYTKEEVNTVPLIQ
jgi:uncharacterized membrane protein YphA (DoxX/SURF4 family)